MKNKSYDSSRSSILSSVDRVLVVFLEGTGCSQKDEKLWLKMAIKNHRSFVFQRKNWFMVLSFYFSDTLKVSWGEATSQRLNVTSSDKSFSWMMFSTILMYNGSMVVVET